jgi:hypothetical protein
LRVLSIISIALILSGLSSCTPDKNTTTNAPVIELLDVVIYPFPNQEVDSLIEIFISYSDVNGDIGLSDSDTLGEFAFGNKAFYNLFVDYFVKDSGQWIMPVSPFNPLDTMNFNERLPNLTPTGNNKYLKGNMRLFIPVAPLGLTPDTVKFRITMWDRELNPSNSIETKEIPLKQL